MVSLPGTRSRAHGGQAAERGLRAGVRRKCRTVAARIHLTAAFGPAALNDEMASAMLAAEETQMSRLAEMGIAKRLGLIVQRLEAGMAAVNHLNTRRSELKADAYRSA
jgi:hypothetical protein